MATMWDSVNVGDELPPLTKVPNAMQLFMFSAVTWNRHLIHYNRDFARSDGLADIAVHRALLGGFLSQMLTEWIGARGRVVKLDWVVRGSPRVDAPAVCHGRVTEKLPDGDARLVRCELGVRDGAGTALVDGSAVVRFED